MPPTFGKRDESSITTNPCGTKKKIAATTHRTSVTGPALADVARCRRPSTATRFIRTRSLSLSARTSWTGCEVVRVVSVVISLEKRDKNKCARVGAILAEREENEQIQAPGMRRRLAGARAIGRSSCGGFEDHFLDALKFLLASNFAAISL